MKETKFRRLRRDELEEVTGQFVKYLSVNGIDAGSWQKMKIKEPSPGRWLHFYNFRKLSSLE